MMENVQFRNYQPPHLGLASCHTCAGRIEVKALHSQIMHMRCFSCTQITWVDFDHSLPLSKATPHLFTVSKEKNLVNLKTPLPLKQHRSWLNEATKRHSSNPSAPQLPPVGEIMGNFSCILRQHLVTSLTQFNLGCAEWVRQLVLWNYGTETKNL